ncbi:hypothetical protein ABW19_dt0209404 [Dactylella cylindrospora]|nr:hypothetical protein ABW19_dt0209404 [Dactylella cylindrospora]
MPSLVPSRRSRVPDTDNGEGSDAETVSASENPPRRSSKQTPSRGSKLVITSKRSSDVSAGRPSSRDPMRSVSGNKRRKLTPDSDAEDEVEEQGEEEDGGVLSQRLNGDSGKNKKSHSPLVDSESEEDDDEEGLHPEEEDEESANGNDTSRPAMEVIIPVAEDYDSEDSESGMADSLDRMKKTVEEIPHAPGAIVRVQLENFVTYTKVTFEPGPSLNMVIGPNGTGKSTLVCAICLGLGFGPEHLGRAKDVAEFVKNGSDFAIIEIELKGRPSDEINPTIRRRINRDGSSQFWADGKKVNAKAVSKLTRMLNIQIDNLCQFLPQDRVVEFAGLGPVALLRETQRAAAPPEVLQGHEKLKGLRSQEVRMQNDLDGLKQSVQTMENRQKVLERDVARLRERESVQKRIDIMQKSAILKEFREAKDARDVIRQEYKEHREKVKKLAEEEAPKMHEINEAEALRESIKTWIDEEKADLAAIERNLKKEKEEGVEELKRKERQAESDLKLLFESEKQRKANIEKSKAAIARYEGILENDPGPPDVTQHNKEIERLHKKVRDMRPDITKYKEAIEPLRAQREQKASEAKALKDSLARIQGVTGQRLNFLKKLHPESYTAHTWLQDNLQRFKGRIHGPPIVECSLRAEYYDEIEALFGGNEMFAFTCTNKDDFREFMNILYGSKGDKGMGMTQVTVKYIEKSLDSFQRAGTQEQVKAWGFDGLALDFIDGPEPVLSMLCNSLGIHKIGISKKRLSPDQQNAIKSQKYMSKWVSNGVLTSIIRRAEYGTETEVNSVVKPARCFKTPPVDTQGINNDKQRLAEYEDQLREISETLEENKKQLGELQAQAEELLKEKAGVQHEKDMLQKDAQQFVKARTHLKNEQEKLAGFESEGGNFRENAGAMEVAIVELNIKRVEAAAKYAEHVRDFVARYEPLAAAELHYIEACSNIQHYNTRNENLRQMKQDLERQASDTEINRQRTICQNLVNQLTEDERDEIKEICDNKTLEQLQDDIKREELRLESIHEGNPLAIKQYEDREKELEGLRARIAAQEANLQATQAQIAETRTIWEPRIDQLVNNISEAFSRSFEFINCAGAVRVRKEGKDGCDFENWQIEILVKFREAESMQVLNAQRQSGGERAVSTVFYLMALQSLARAPFRVVDEINQGMDPRNERLVHKRMVKIACKKHTSQ